MRYIICLFALVFLPLSGILGQQNAKRDSLRKAFVPELSIGAKGSFLLSRVNFSPGVPQSFLMGFGGGLMLKYAGQRGLGIQLELNYAPKGWQENWSDTASYVRKFHYLEMPFMTNIFVGKKRGFFLLNFGPVLSYLMKDEEIMSSNSPIRTYYNDIIQNRVELGICAGMGTVIKTPIGHFQVEVRYAHNILNFFGSTVFSTSQNQSISASVAYLWGFQVKKSDTKKSDIPSIKPEKSDTTKTGIFKKKEKKPKDTITKKEKPKKKKKGEPEPVVPPVNEKTRSGVKG